MTEGGGGDIHHTIAQLISPPPLLFIYGRMNVLSNIFWRFLVPFGATRIHGWTTSWNEAVQKIAPHYLSNKNVYMAFLSDIVRRFNISEEAFIVKNRLPPAEDCTIQGNSSTTATAKNIMIHVSDEHNVVLPGGRHLPPNSRMGRVPTRDGKGFYLVCMNYPVCVETADIVLEYSNLNIQNIRLSGFYNDAFLQKFVYIPAIPLLYKPAKLSHPLRPMMTTFGYTNPRGDRRTEISEQINALRIKIDNIHYNSLEEYEARLDETQILVNVHQTPHHHTLEEFRVLPALLRGVLIVSEWVPLQDALPFRDYIIFAPYDELVSTAARVYHNYTIYWQLFFGEQSKLNETLSQMRAMSYKALATRVLEIALLKNLTYHP